MRAMLCALLLAVCTAPGPEPAQGQPARSGGADEDARGGGAAARPGDGEPVPAALPPRFAELVDSHNRARAEHCAQPLTWSPRLAAFAQEWADQLRDSGCRFDHRPRNPYGENLAAFSPPGSENGGSVTGIWVDERKLYDWNAPGFSMKTGYFTQVVWGATREVGCGAALCSDRELWVCNYAPPGNVEGLYPQQVVPQGCR